MWKYIINLKRIRKRAREREAAERRRRLDTISEMAVSRKTTLEAKVFDATGAKAKRLAWGVVCGALVVIAGTVGAVVLLTKKTPKAADGTVAPTRIVAATARPETHGKRPPETSAARNRGIPPTADTARDIPRKKASPAPPRNVPIDMDKLPPDVRDEILRSTGAK